MKFATSATGAALLALAAPAIASPVSINDLAPRKHIDLKEQQCAVFSSLAQQLKASSASAYCSTFIASTTTVTSTATITNSASTTTTVPLTTATLTTTTAPAPTATQTVYSNCALPGYDKQTPAGYWYDGSGAYGTFATCSAKCISDTQCKSFAVGSNVCLLYAAPVANNVNPATTSPYLFYDITCPASSVPASVPAIPPPVSSTNGTASAKIRRDPPLPPKPEQLKDKVDAKISSVCSCIISAPYTSTIVQSTSTTVSVTQTIVTSEVLATITNVSTQTLPSVTVTVTTTA